MYGTPPQNGAGTTALITSILGLLCCPVVLSIVAIIFGRKGKRLAAQGLATNGGVAQAGYIIGIIGLILGVLTIVGWIALIATGNSTWEFNTNTNTFST